VGEDGDEVLLELSWGDELPVRGVVVCVVGAEPYCLFSENKMILLLKMGEARGAKLPRSGYVLVPG
jgi:hypothetical protein